MLKFLVGNKSDQEGKRAVSTEQGKELAKQYNIQFFETSAKTSSNIDHLFETSTKTFMETQKTIGNRIQKPVSGKSGVNLMNDNPAGGSGETKKGCC